MWSALESIVLLRARSAEKRSGTGPTSRQLQEKVGGVAPAVLFSLGDCATGGVSDSEHTRRRLGAGSANRWGSYEINRSDVEAVRLLAHSCPGRVRRHVRSWRKPTGTSGT